MESYAFLLGIIGTISLVLAIGFIYYAFKNAVRLKGAVTQYIIAAGALFFVISGVSSAIVFLIFDTLFIVVYITFIVGFLLILIGEIYSGIIIRQVIGKKPWITMARTFSHNNYRFCGILVILLFTIPFWTLDIIIGPASIYGMATLFFTMLSFVLFLIGERRGSQISFFKICIFDSMRPHFSSKLCFTKLQLAKKHSLSMLYVQKSLISPVFL